MIQATSDGKIIPPLQPQKCVKSKGVAEGAKVASCDETLESTQVNSFSPSRNSPHRRSIWGKIFGKRKTNPLSHPEATRDQHIDNLRLLSKFVTHPENAAYLRSTGLFRNVPSPSEKDSASRDLPQFLVQNHGSSVSDVHILAATLMKDAFRGSITNKEKLLLALVAGIESASLAAGIPEQDKDELCELLKQLDKAVISSALKTMVTVCREIEKCSALNKMDFHNLAVCLAPILYPQTTETQEGTMLLLQMTTLVQNFFEDLLQGIEATSSHLLSPELLGLRQAVFDLVNTTKIKSETKEIKQSAEVTIEVKLEQEEDVQPSVSMGATNVTTLDPDDPEGIYFTIGSFPTSSLELSVNKAQRALPSIPVSANATSLVPPQDGELAIYSIPSPKEVEEIISSSSSTESLVFVQDEVLPLEVALEEALEEALKGISEEILEEESPPSAPLRTVSLAEPIYDSIGLDEATVSSRSTDLTEVSLTISASSSNSLEVEIEQPPISVPVPRPRTFSSRKSGSAVLSTVPPKPLPRTKHLPKIKSLPSLLDDELSLYGAEILLSSTESLSDVLESAVPELVEFEQVTSEPQPRTKKKVPPPVQPRVSSLPK